ncbi:MAG: Rrf2 family transcriptional regulator [Gammaproteobacteria bacterium]|nr:Rrf2 family transcriptional regulator [Gammaproteobacteria bacterium]
MTSSTRFSMAVHIMTALAYLAEKASSEVLARTVNTNAVVVRRILGDLNRAGLIHAERGNAGGFTLARTPKQISLLDIYRAVMEERELVSLHENPENRKCPVSCKVRGTLAAHLHKAQSVYERELQKVMLADIEQAM